MAHLRNKPSGKPAGEAGDQNRCTLHAPSICDHRGVRRLKVEYRGERTGQPEIRVTIPRGPRAGTWAFLHQHAFVLDLGRTESGWFVNAPDGSELFRPAVAGMFTTLRPVLAELLGAETAEEVLRRLVRHPG